MTIEILQAKLQNAIITGSSIRYRGSITIDEDIMDEMGVVEYQRCDVNLKGEDQYGIPFRGNTYILAGPRGTGCVEANGALSYHLSIGDTVHINVYCQMLLTEAKDYKPVVVESNRKY